MSFLDDLINRSADLLAQPMFSEPAPTEQFAIHHDMFDKADWAQLVTDVPALTTNRTELENDFDYVPSFYEDMFNLLHQGDPKVHDPEAMAEQYRPNREMVSGFQGLAETQGLRLSTMHDKYATAMALISMQDKLREAFQRMASAQEAAQAAAEARAQAQAAAQALMDALDAAAEAAGTGGEEAAALALQEALSNAEAAAQAAGASAATSQTQAQLGAAQAKAAMQSAAHTAAQERSEEESMMSSYGVEPGVLKRMPFEERRKLAERLRTNRLAKFAKLIGQFRMLADAERRRKVQHRPDMVVGVELGNDLQRLTAGELSNLAVPELEDDFWRRWANNELVQFKLEGTERQGQGPILVVCDESGSMSAGHLKGGTREAWSKALSLALCDQARRGKRDFIYIGFSYSQQQWVCEFPGGRAPIEKVIEFTEHFWGGGTSYREPLTMAQEIVLRYHADGKPRPDVVFITDEDHPAMDPQFMARWNATKATTSMRCYGIAIGCYGGRGALAQIADDTRTVDEMTSDPSNMSDLFRTL
jgi:uncharacterized protein with von Willebrand factor type A (vWA) domain